MGGAGCRRGNGGRGLCWSNLGCPMENQRKKMEDFHATNRAGEAAD
jgi:hypothetical protein